MRPTIYWDDVEPGTRLTPLEKGPIRIAHLVRWAASMENWHRIHYDWNFATEVDGLPDLVINGSWKQHVMMQLVKDWAGPEGWVWKLKTRYMNMDFPGDKLVGWGVVVEKSSLGRLGVVRVNIGLKNSRGHESTQGEAMVMLPRKGGAAVPYPFAPPEMAAR